MIRTHNVRPMATYKIAKVRQIWLLWPIKGFFKARLTRTSPEANDIENEMLEPRLGRVLINA